MSDIKIVATDEDLERHLRERVPFRTPARTGLNDVRFEFGAFHGHAGPLPDPIWDHLPTDYRVENPWLRYQTGSLANDPSGKWYDKFNQDMLYKIVEFVVYSYDTIIGWYSKENHATGEQAHWTVTESTLSASTSLHQTRLIQLLKQIGETPQ